MFDFRQAQHEAHENSKAHGFYDDEEIIARSLSPDSYMAIRRRLILARLAMIASEVGEAVDAVRASDVNSIVFTVTVPVTDWIPPSNDPDFTAIHTRDLHGTALGSELADIVIRTMDLATYMRIDLTSEIQAKMAKNSLREHRHGKLA
jgi:NTP pyrophosphatase (non-canonical NTP hydrolase)